MSTEQPPAGTRVTYGQQFRRCGKSGCQYCEPGRPGHGPYWFAYWRENGRRHARYLGRTAPPEAVTAEEDAGLAPHAAGAAPDVALRVRTLGGFTVWRGSEELPEDLWRRRKVAALFKALLAADGCRVPREQVMESLWPEAEPEVGERNLRATLHLLRKILDPRAAAESYVRLHGDTLSLALGGAAAPAPDWLDALAFTRAARQALAGRSVSACRAALAYYGGEYLPDDRYEEWAVSRREELRQLRLAVLLHLAELLLEEGDGPETERSLGIVLAIEPCHEGAACALMRLQTIGGRRQEALRTYHTLEDALKRELDLAPEAATQEVYRAIIEGRIQSPTHAAAWLDAAGTVESPSPAHMETPRRLNLPAPVTRFIGRARELQTIGALLARPFPEGRLLTLTGAGGSGKTRLAIETAAMRAGQYADGVFLVELASVPGSRPAVSGTLASGTRLIALAIAAALGVREQPETPLWEALAAYLRDRTMLLVLDNCEHVVASCAVLVSALLRDCPRLSILATSREALGVAGETAWPVPGLSVPSHPQPRPTAAAETAVPAKEVGLSEAAQLFADRVRLGLPEFAIAEANAATVGRICRRLDGIPLALELAAARVRLLGLNALDARLDDCFRVLTRGDRAAPLRHQTLQAALDWSYDLLDETERLLLRRLAVFAGGWQLDAAEAVCGGEAPGIAALPSSRILDLLSSLVDKSLVMIEAATDPAGTIRYTLLETVRQYGQMRLVEAGEEAWVRDRHCGWCMALAETAEPELRGTRGAAWLERLDLEHDNLRAAARWCAQGRGSAEAGLRLAAALWQFWERRGYMSEGRRWLDGALARVEAFAGAERAGRALSAWRMSPDREMEPDLEVADSAEQHATTRLLHTARALNGAGMLAYRQGDVRSAAVLHAECLAIRRGIGDAVTIAASLHNLGNVLLDQGAYEQAVDLFEESVALKAGTNDRWGMATTLVSLGGVAFHRGEYAKARSRYEEALAILRDQGDRWSTAVVLSNLASSMAGAGDNENAILIAEESLALRRELGDLYGIAASTGNIGEMLVSLGQHARGAEKLREALAQLRQIDVRTEVPWLLEELAAAVLDGQPERSARLFAAASSLRTTLNMPRPLGEAAEHEQRLRAVRAILGDDVFPALAAAAQSLSIEQIFALALEGEDGGTAE